VVGGSSGGGLVAGGEVVDRAEHGVKGGLVAFHGRERTAAAAGERRLEMIRHLQKNAVEPVDIGRARCPRRVVRLLHEHALEGSAVQVETTARLERIAAGERGGIRHLRGGLAQRLARLQRAIGCLQLAAQFARQLPVHQRRPAAERAEQQQQGQQAESDARAEFHSSPSFWRLR
jgi:hypothetical protein